MFRRQLYCSSVLVTLWLSLGAQADIDPRTGLPGGDVAAQNFTQMCQGELPADRQQAFFAGLEDAERALATANETQARAAMTQASQASYRGGAETDIGVKCFGEQTTRRFFAARLGLYRLQAAASADRVTLATLYSAASQGGSEAIFARVGDEPARGFADSVRLLETTVAQADAEREFGAFFLAEEDIILEAFRHAVGPLRTRASQNSQAALQAEERDFNRPPTPQELAAADSMNSAQALAQAVAGVDIDAAASKEAMVLDMRIQASQEQLRAARDWDLDAPKDPSSRPASQRARERGEAMLAKANDPQQRLRVRDEFYRAAEWYFEFGGFATQATAAGSRRAEIQPALMAEQEQRERELEARRAEMEQKAQAVQQAVDDMQKTEAEKQRFKEEADALEAELGF